MGLLATLLTGCDAGTQSLEWYKTHDKERNAKVEDCKKRPTHAARRTAGMRLMLLFALTAIL
ncbi:hypothetical protein BW31_01446 [Pantoea agglomerans]|uniref:EexN family lipoprotein n=1 Tax=Enterobacter agglomerans TaxID=549 RepID=UPI00044E830A|nr:hypothetical protein BW31_01446 [Pantoea agglomerans]